VILADALDTATAALDRAQAAELVRRFSELDRFPASAGLDSAAELVAEAAEAAGVQDVDVLRWPVAGERQRWWTFGAPASWTPGPSRLSWRGRVLVEYPRDAFGLAVNSAASDGARAALVRGRSAPWRDAVVLIEEPVVAPTLLREIELAGARGVVCSPGWPAEGEQDCTRRVELPPGAGIFAFSLRPSVMRELIAGHQVGDQIEATVRVVTTGTAMPVVTGVIPGLDPSLGEVALHAHLDHPRPSANDNASGVVACLQVARALARLPGRRRGVRFLWGPEFTGSAAYLHDVVSAGTLPDVVALLNLDMVGEHERNTGGMLNVERSPLGTPDVASAVVGMVLDSLPGPRRTYAGARPVPAVPWVQVPFVGASDHLLYVDRATPVSATSLSHHPDRYRHSSCDTADRVDSDRLLAVSSCAAVAVQLLAGGPDTDQLVLASMSARYGDLLDVVRAAGCAATEEQAGWIEPSAAGRAHRRLAAVLSGGDRDLTWIAGLAGVEPDRVASYRDSLRAVAASLTPLLPPADGGRPAGPALSRAWSGPFNLFAALDAVDERARQRAWDGIGQDRGAGYARLVALALAADGEHDLDGVVEAAAFSSGLPMSLMSARGWLAALLDAGWLTLGEEPR
jgi:Peptidase family M28